MQEQVKNGCSSQRGSSLSTKLEPGEIVKTEMRDDDEDEEDDEMSDDVDQGLDMSMDVTRERDERAADSEQSETDPWPTTNG